MPVSVYQIPESLLTTQLTAFTDMILQTLQIEAVSVIYSQMGKHRYVCSELIHSTAMDIIKVT